MKLKLDSKFLADVGLKELVPNEANVFLRYVYQTLEMRTGIRLANLMTDQQLDEFEAFFEAADDKGAFVWLERNFPNYSVLVNEEYVRVKTEIEEAAPKILALSESDPLSPPKTGAVAPEAGVEDEDHLLPAPIPSRTRSARAGVAAE